MKTARKTPKLGLPSDPAVLAAIGAIALRHAQLENAMRMIIKDLAGVTREEALDATAYQGFRELKERTKKLAKKRLGEGESLLKLQALLERAARATEKRNAVLHSVWGFDGVEHVLRNNVHKYEPAPKIEQLRELVDELQDVKSELADARNKGFIAKGLKNTTIAKPLD